MAGTRLWRLTLSPRPDDGDHALLGPEDGDRVTGAAPEVAAAFLARRALARAIAAEALVCEPASVTWGTDSGRPWVAGGGRRCWASLSTAGGVALLAIGPGRFAVDAEPIATPVPDATQVAAAFFAPSEVDWIGTGETAGCRFLAVWVRKEAVVKCTGEGMARALDTFVVDPEASVAEVRHADGRPFGLHTVRLDVDGLVAAAALAVVS